MLQGAAQCCRGASGLVFQELDQFVFTLAGNCVERCQFDLDIAAAGRAQAQHRRGCAFGGVVEQALVHVADLLDVECAKREAPQFRAAARHAHLEELQRLQQMQHRAIADR